MTNNYAGAKVARNLIHKYGYARFLRLIDMFQQNVSGTEIGEQFDVTRQRVNQWKNKLGDQRYNFVLDPEVQKLVNDLINGHIKI